MTNDTYDDLFEAAGQKYNVDPQLIKTVFHLEGANPNSPNSPKGAEGGMQIMRTTQREVGVADPRNMGQAIDGAARYISQGLDHKLVGTTFETLQGTPEAALLYYHGGPNTNEWGPKTKGYMERGRSFYDAMALERKETPESKSGAEILRRRIAPEPDAAPSVTPPETPAAPNAAAEEGRRILRERLGTTQPETPKSGADAGTPQPSPTETPVKNDSGYWPSSGPGMASMRQGLAPAPNTTYGDVLPLAKDDASGDIRLAMPNFVRSALTGGLDLLEGDRGMEVPAGANPANPLSARLTPDASGALMTVPVGGRLLNRPGLAPAEIPRSPVVEPAPAQRNMLTYDPLGPDFKANPFNPNMPPGKPPGPSSPVPPGAPQPQPSTGSTAGAQQYTGPVPPKSGAQAATDLAKSVTQTAADRVIGGKDDTVYVPGVQRPHAAVEFSPENSVNEKMLKGTDTAFAAHLAELEKNNNNVRVDYYAGEHGVGAGDANAIAAAETLRSEAARPALEAAFGKQKAIDAQAVVDHIDQILASPSGKRSAVTAVLKDVRSKLFDADGKLETMPDQLYLARQNITDKLSSAKQATDSDLKLAKRELESVKDFLDPVIESGAPGYQKYLADYRKHSQPINAMEFLQKFTMGAGKLTDAQGVMQLTKVQKLLETIAQQRASKDATAPAKSLTEAQVQAVINLRNDLAAVSHKDALGRVAGSDTTQQTTAAGKWRSGRLGQAVDLGANALTHGAMYYITEHPELNLMYQFGARPMYQNYRAKKVEAAAAALRNKLMQVHPSNPPN